MPIPSPRTSQNWGYLPDAARHGLSKRGDQPLIRRHGAAVIAAANHDRPVRFRLDDPATCTHAVAEAANDQA